MVGYRRRISRRRDTAGAGSSPRSRSACAWSAAARAANGMSRSASSGSSPSPSTPARATVIARSVSPTASASSARTASKFKARNLECSANSSSARARCASASPNRPCRVASWAARSRAFVSASGPGVDPSTTRNRSTQARHCPSWRRPTASHEESHATYVCGAPSAVIRSRPCRQISFTCRLAAPSKQLPHHRVALTNAQKSPASAAAACASSASAMPPPSSRMARDIAFAVSAYDSDLGEPQRRASWTASPALAWPDSTPCHSSACASSPIAHA